MISIFLEAIFTLCETVIDTFIYLIKKDIDFFKKYDKRG